MIKLFVTFQKCICSICTCICQFIKYNCQLYKIYFIQFAKCICPICKIYMFNLQNVFLQYAKCTCPSSCLGCSISSIGLSDVSLNLWFSHTWCQCHPGQPHHLNQGGHERKVNGKNVNSEWGFIKYRPPKKNQISTKLFEISTTQHYIDQISTAKVP